MKILFLADTHISERHGMGGAGGKHGVSDFDAATAQLLAEVRDYSERPDGIDLIVHLGDVFDRARPTPNEYVIAQRLIESLADEAPVYIVEGNHDRDATQRALEPLHTLRNIEIIAAPTVAGFHAKGPAVLSAPTVKLHFLPYPPPAARMLDEWNSKAERNAELGAGLDLILADLARQAEAEPDVHHILCAHVTFAGSRYAATRTVGQWDLQVPTDSLGSFDAVFAGHLHVRQKIGHYENAHYLGPLTRHSFSDAGIPCGFCVYDTDTGAREWHDLEGGIDFITFDYNDLATFDYVPSPSKSVLRLVGEVADAATYHEAEAVCARYRDAAGFLHVRNDVTIAKPEGALRQASADTVRDVFDAYNEARPDAVPEDMRGEVVACVDDLMAEVKR